MGGGSTVQAAVAAILGVEVTAREPELAQVGCRYPVTRADLKYAYDGLTDCRGAVLLAGGPKECPVGCIGLGSCAKACPFDALAIGPDRLPVVDPYKCTGCGTCVRTCPMGIMGLTSVSNRILDEITVEDCSAPCQRRCPAGINIPEQIQRTARGDYQGALAVIKERNPLPLICGRICPHPCQDSCRRLLLDEAIAIRELKRVAADQAGVANVPQPRPEPRPERVAIVGAGPAGLSCAYHLARRGIGSVVFEAGRLAGGALAGGVPAYRLPREVLAREVAVIQGLGVDLRLNAPVGRDPPGPTCAGCSRGCSWGGAGGPPCAWGWRARMPRGWSTPWPTCGRSTWAARFPPAGGWRWWAGATWPWTPPGWPCAGAPPR